MDERDGGWGGTTPRHVQAAERAVMVAEQELAAAVARHGNLPHDPEALASLRGWVAEYGHRVRQITASGRKIERDGWFLRAAAGLQHLCGWLHGFLRLEPPAWWAPGLIGAAGLLAPLCATLAVFGARPVAIFATAGAAFIALTAVLVGLSRQAAVSWVATQRRLNQSHRRAVAAERDRVEHLLAQAAGQLALGEALSALHRSLAAAREHLTLLRDRQNDRRRQLLSVGWRDLRGEPFERFLQAVFQHRGYEARLTRRTGDFGVDLVLTRAGVSIAVQAKGYEGTVGVDAVQQVVAGRTMYGCDACIVVTNSRFTDPAADLARCNGCLLIAGEQIPDLILGRVRLPGC